MRVLAFTSNFRLCGQGIATHHLANHLARRGHDVRLEVFDSTQQLRKVFDRAAYKADYRPSVPLSPSTGIHVLRQVLYLLKLQRAKGFDVALGMDSHDGAAMGAAFAKESGLPVACIAWGNELDDLGTIERGFIKGVDLLLPVSRWAKNRYMEDDFDEGRMRMLPPGVDVDVFTPPARRPEGLGIVTVTSLERGCGVDQLIVALRTLLDDGQDAWLTVIGNGPERKRLAVQARELLLEDNVVFKAGLRPAEVAEAMRGHHVFALLPRWARGEGGRDFSIAMLEAASCGLGIVGTDHCGVGDALRFCNGTKVPAENPARAAKAIVRAARTAEDGEVDEEETRGRMRAWEEVALELEMMMEELVYE